MNIQRIAAAAALALSALAAPATQAAIVGQTGTPVSISTNGDNLAAASFSAVQTGDLYIAITFTLDAGTLNGNDFLALWLDNAGNSNSAHTNRPNLGLKTNEGNPGALDWMVRGSGTGGSFAPDQAAIGSSTTLWAHLYKSSAAGNYNRFDLWTNPTGIWADVLATTPEARSTLDSGVASLSRFGLRAANLDTGDRFTLQSLSISNTVPVSSVPEPGSLALAAAGLALLGGLRARRRG